MWRTLGTLDSNRAPGRICWRSSRNARHGSIGRSSTSATIAKSLSGQGATSEPASLSSRVDLLVRAGSLPLQHGADAGRVETSLQQIEPGLGIDRIDAVVMSKTLLLTATRQDAHHTRIARTPIAGVNMNILSEVEQLLG